MTTPENSSLHSPSPQEERSQLRERILHRFEVWLDEALDPEAVPQGLAAEILDQLDAEDLSATGIGSGIEDLQAVSATLVGLTDASQKQREALQKIHEDMPAVQGLTDAVSTLLDAMAVEQKKQAQEQAKQAQEREKQLQEQRVQARREIFKEVLDAVIEMRDRLAEQLRTAQGQVTSTQELAPPLKRRWWQRRMQNGSTPENSKTQVAVEALIKGCQLALQQVDESLDRWHVQPMDCVGQPFDSERMKAVDQEARPDVTQGTILEVVRDGYTWNKTLFRMAEVKIAQNASPTDESAAQ